MKILIFNTLYHPNQVGGAEKSVQLLAESLVNKGVNIVIVSTTSKEDYIDIINGIKVYYLNHRNRYWSIDSKNKNIINKVAWHSIDMYNMKFSKVIEKIFDEEQPDVVHTNNLTGLSIYPWLIAKNNNIPVVHTLRDFSLICSKASMFKDNKNCEGQCIDCKALCSYKKKLSNQGIVKYLVGNSEFMVSSHKREGYFNTVNSKRIFNGTVIHNNDFTEKQSDDDRLKFFYMGRIDGTKGVDLLLDVFKDLEDVDLYLAGNIYDDNIQHSIDSNLYKNNIHFLGFVNPYEYLGEMDVLIAPSLWNEPLPRVVLEAYSFNKPVIGSTRGGIPECIIEGKTGYLFNPDDKESLKNIVISIINNKNVLEQMKTNIPDYLKQFNIEITSQEYLDIFTEVTNETEKPTI